MTQCGVDELRGSATFCGSGGGRLQGGCKAQRDALPDAAKQVFPEIGVDAPIREIASKAGVGLGTLYRRFPKRSDLIAAAFRRELDSCAESAASLGSQHAPVDALALGWGLFGFHDHMKELIRSLALG
jgi:AcrR family transcriptional regulator